MDLSVILGAWPIPSNATVRPVDAGTNNRSFVIEAGQQQLFLRIYQNQTGLERICYEHALLRALAEASLPFAVPRPLATTTGDTVVILDNGTERKIAALFPVIPGRHPDRAQLGEVEQSGAALGQLHQALARLTLPPRPNAATYGDLVRIHPRVADLTALVAALPTDDASRRRVAALFEDVSAAVPSLAARLPRQIIHGDFARSNVLLAEPGVTGLLDFEFAGPDLRAIDLACGLWSFTLGYRGSGAEWPIIEAFSRGYRQFGALDFDEWAALPTLLRLRDLAALVHRVGRRRQGLESETAIGARVADLLATDEWLRAGVW
jgi:Ser/Thr protein kinase RdoA (MazF antagonist)